MYFEVLRFCTALCYDTAASYEVEIPVITWAAVRDLDPFSTVLPYVGTKHSQVISGLSPKRDWGPKRVNSCVTYF